MAESKEAKTIETSETTTSPAKNSSSLEETLVRAECIGAELANEDLTLTVAENDCVLTSSDDDVEDTSAFVAERLQCLGEGSVEKLIG